MEVMGPRDQKQSVAMAAVAHNLSSMPHRRQIKFHGLFMREYYMQCRARRRLIVHKAISDFSFAAELSNVTTRLPPGDEEMDRIWLKNYPEGVPAEIDVNQYSSLVDLLEDSFKKYANDDAYVFMDKRMTYAELDRQSMAMACYLQSLGLKKGDRVAVMMPNVLQ